MTQNIFSKRKIHKERGFLLSLFLLLVILTNGYGAYMILTSMDLANEIEPEVSNGTLYFVAVTGIISTILAIGIWVWKKSAVYGFYLLSLVVFFISLGTDAGFLASSTNLILPVIIYLLTKSRWEHFE